MSSSIIDKAVTGVVYGVVLATSILMGSALYAKLGSEQIKSLDQLTRVIEEERRPAGIPDSVRIIPIVAAKREGQTHKITDSEFEVTIDTVGANRNEVCHELYHIPQLMSGSSNTFRYLFYGEPTAILYEAYRIKL